VLQSFDDTLQRVRSATGPSPEWPSYFVDLFAVTGVSIATLGPLLGSETLSASDTVAARLDEVQFDLGEGPCWDAMRTARPVFSRDIRDSQSRWPGFSEAIGTHGVRSLIALPLRVGPLQIGAVDMYSVEEKAFNADQTRRAAMLAGAVGQQVLRAAISRSGDEGEGAPGVFSRRVIHQATGMVLAQLDISADDAALVLQGHAFAAGLSMVEVAQSVVDRTLDFSTIDGEPDHE
jgi:hypothetical protein